MSLKSLKRLPGSRKRRGSIVAVSLVLMALAAIASLLMFRTAMDHQNLNERRRELWTAFYMAESGIAQVQHWALYPSEFTANSNLFQSASGSASGGSGSGLISANADFAATYPSLYAAVHGSSSGYAITESMLDSMNAGAFTSQYGTAIGDIKEITLLPPEASDPIPCEFKIRSVGRAQNGIERVVVGYANLNPVIAVKIPAALISFNTVGSNGNFKLHWGEGWSKNAINFQSQNQYSYLSSDPKAIYRCQTAMGTWGGGWKVNGKNPDINTSLNYPTDMGVPAAWDAHFYQNVPAAAFDTWGGWPNFDYQTFKNLALSHGRYYSTDASGNVYRDGVEDSAHKVDFMDEFGVADPNTAPFDLVFIDTTDGNPPAANGSNLATISNSGLGATLKGVYYVGANLSFGGAGNPPSVTAKNPYTNSDETLSKMFLHGVMYNDGTMNFQGNPGVYGSIITKKGFTGGGTPDIYYNQDLANGLSLGDGNVGSPFSITLHTNFGE